MDRLIIGTRGSELALWQAKVVGDALAEKTGVGIDTKIVKTTGDRIDDKPFSQIEGKGFFTKEIEQELTEGKIDLAVHSMKDLQTVLPEGLSLGAVCFRGDAREVVLIRPDSYDDSQTLGVKAGSTIGTSSVRRQSQIVNLMPSVTLKGLRGNVPTRIGKLRDGQYDAIVIAYAGIQRLDIDVSDLEVRLLDFDTFLPAPAQGILAVEIRDDDSDVQKLVSSIDEPNLRTQVRLERGLLARFEGGCQLPLGAISIVESGRHTLKAAFGISDNDRWAELRRTEVSGVDPDAVVEDAYRKLTT
jgi:hydroxymethylbilane synthase